MDVNIQTLRLKGPYYRIFNDLKQVSYTVQVDSVIQTKVPKYISTKYMALKDYTLIFGPLNGSVLVWKRNLIGRMTNTSV